MNRLVRMKRQDYNSDRSRKAYTTSIFFEDPRPPESLPATIKQTAPPDFCKTKFHARTVKNFVKQESHRSGSLATRQTASGLRLDTNPRQEINYAAHSNQLSGT